MADFRYTCAACGLRWDGGKIFTCPACGSQSIMSRVLEFGEFPESEQLLRLQKEITGYKQ